MIINTKWKNIFNQNIIDMYEKDNKDIIPYLIVKTWLENIGEDFQKKNMTMKEYKQTFEKEQNEIYKNSILVLCYIYTFCSIISMYEKQIFFTYLL